MLFKRYLSSLNGALVITREIVMKLKRLLSTLVVCAISTLQAESLSDVEYLTELKTTHWPSIYQRSDVAALRELTHPDFVIIDANGNITTRSEELIFLESFQWPHSEFQYDIESIKLFENGTAIVAGTGRASGKNKRGDYCFVYTSSNVLIKTERRWQAIQSHVSGFKAECQ